MAGPALIGLSGRAQASARAATASAAAKRLKDAFSPLSDLRGSAAYRRALVSNLFEKFFYEHSAEEVAA